MTFPRSRGRSRPRSSAAERSSICSSRRWKRPSGPGPQLATIGTARDRKSRLARELIGRAGTRVLVGRCLSYGEGITYWPLQEMVSQIGDVRAALEEGPDGDLAAVRIAGATGDSDTPSTPEEIAWGARKLFEAMARMNPLLVVFDDIHWAGPTFLDLIEYVTAFAHEVPLLVLCTLSADLFDQRPTWTARPNATVLMLEPLSAADCAELVSDLGESASDTVERIVQTAEGNPLFVEQLVATLAEEGAGLKVPRRCRRCSPPASIASRNPSGRSSSGVPSKVGSFTAGPSLRCSPRAGSRGGGRTAADAGAQGASSDPITRSCPATTGSGSAMPSSATPHTTRSRSGSGRFCTRATRRGSRHASATTPDEIIGITWRSYRYGAELERPTPWSVSGRRAAPRGRARRHMQGDMHAAANLLGRAADLIPGHPRRPELLAGLGAALRHRRDRARDRCSRRRRPRERGR